MGLQLNTNYPDLLQLIQQMSLRELSQLKSDVSVVINSKRRKSSKEDFTALLLSGPTISDEQYEQYLENRKIFNQWRQNWSV